MTSRHDDSDRTFQILLRHGTRSGSLLWGEADHSASALGRVRHKELHPRLRGRLDEVSVVADPESQVQLRDLQRELVAHAVM